MSLFCVAETHIHQTYYGNSLHNMYWVWVDVVLCGNMLALNNLCWETKHKAEHI